MDLRIKPVRCLLAVAELQSFTRAAEQLNMTQPSLSIQISQLERYLGFRLFERSTRQVILTSEGAGLIEPAKRLIRESDRMLNAVDELRSDLFNQLRIGAALYTFTIPERQELIEGFMDDYPNISLTVDAHTQVEIVSRILSHSLDVAIVIGLGVPDSEFEGGARAELLFPSGLHRRTLRRERIGLRVPVMSPLAALDEIPPELLAGQSIVMPSKEHGARIVEPMVELFEAYGATVIVPPEGTGIATERYGAKYQLPAVTFGWFDVPEGSNTVRRDIGGLEMYTELAILSRRPNEEGAAARFLSFAERTCGSA